MLKHILITMIHQIALLEDKEKFTKVYTTYLSYLDSRIEYNLIYKVMLKISIVVRVKRKCSFYGKRTIRASIPTVIFSPFKLILTRVPCHEPKAFMDKGGTLTLSIQIPWSIWYWTTKQIVWFILICLKVDLFIGCHLRGVTPQSRSVCTWIYS